MLELIRDTSRTTSCDGAIGGQEQGERECPANLVEQESLQGRLKLVVTLPDLGQLWSMDAQEILDGEPGAYPPCRPEQVVRLDAERPDEVVREFGLTLDAGEVVGLLGPNGAGKTTSFCKKDPLTSAVRHARTRGWLEAGTPPRRTSR